MLRTLTLCRLFDIRVAVDVSWLAVYFFATLSIASNLTDLPRPAAYAFAAVCALLLFVSVIAHEFAHALVARRFGVRTRSIVLFVFGGVATLETEPPTPRAEAAIALAGPAMSALLAVLAFGLFFLISRSGSSEWSGALAHVTAYLALANGVLAVFNLIPAFPMDGGRVLRAAIWQRRKSRAAATGAASLVGLVLAGVLALGGAVAMIGFHLWQYGWYVAIGAYLLRQGWLQLHESRLMERLERVRVGDVMEAVAASDVPADAISLTASATALDAVTIFRTSNRAQIAIVDAGHLTGWLQRERVFAIVDLAA